MKLLTPAAFTAAALCSAVLTLPFPTRHDPVSTEARLEIRLTATKPGRTEVFFDNGRGYHGNLSASAQLSSNSRTTAQFPIPAGNYRGFRFDPIDNDGDLEIEAPRLVDQNGNVIHVLTVEDFQPVHQIAKAEIASGVLRIMPEAGSNDPQLVVKFGQSIRVGSPHFASIVRPAIPAAIMFGAILAILALVERSAHVRAAATVVCQLVNNHPTRGISIVAFSAAIVSCYPVVFGGRSFVSPQFQQSIVLLYERLPTLPGYTESAAEPTQGSDVGAMAWHHHPLSMVEHRALWRDGQLPLWNRYNLGGSPLLGQGQSMFGDPLHFIPVLADGAAWAWDLKFVLAKALFAMGIALTVFSATRHLPAAILSGISAPFIGFFIYRLNHPAFFSVCYAPWILYAWCGIVRTAGARSTVHWIGGLLLACWCELNSGTVKEAYMLLAGLNLTGAATLLAARLSLRVKLAKALAIFAGFVVFAMLSAPVWVTFLDTMTRAQGIYNHGVAHQIHPALLIGFFDEIFFRPLQAGSPVWNPAVNFLTLAGVAFAIVTLRTQPGDRYLQTLLGSGLATAAIVFGIIPPSWITAVPLLRNIAHTDNTFSCVLLVQFMVLAGIGYATAATRLSRAEGRGDLLATGALIAFVIVPYLALTNTYHRISDPMIFQFLGHGGQLQLDSFVQTQLAVLPLSLALLMMVARSALVGSGWNAVRVILGVTCLSVVLWRHGQHLRTRFDDFVFNPGIRVDFHARSAAMDFIQTHVREPGRVVGIGGNLFPGWSAAYNLESTGGPDAIVSPHYRELIDTSGLKLTWNWVVSPTLENFAYEKAFYDFLNVRYYVNSHLQQHSLGEFLVPQFGGDLDVYESPAAWARAYFTDRLAFYDRPEEIGQMVRSEANDGRPFALMQSSDSARAPAMSPILNSRVVVPAASYQLSANTTAFDVVTPGPGIVVLHETWWQDDFRVRVNGEQRECLRVNHAFKGVAIDAPGTYHIEFTYWPRTLTRSLMLAAAGFIALVAALYFTRQRSGHATKA